MGKTIIQSPIENVVLHYGKEIVSERKGASEFIRLTKKITGKDVSENSQESQKCANIFFNENPLIGKNEAIIFSDGEGLHFEGLGYDSMRLAVKLFFDEFADAEDMTPKKKMTVSGLLKKRGVSAIGYLNEETLDIADGNIVSPTFTAKGRVRIIWQNHTVYPGETVNMLGGDFEASSTVIISRLTDEGEGYEDERKLSPVTVTDNNIMFVIPEDMNVGIYRVFVTNSFGLSEAVYINAPDVWWYMGDEGKEVSRGGVIQIIGNALSLEQNGDTARLKNDKSPSVMLLSENGKANLLMPYFCDGYCMKAKIPSGLERGVYKLYVHNGYGAQAGWIYHTKISVTDRRVRHRENVLKISPDGERDMYEDFRSAMNALEKVGGGKLEIEDGDYTILHGLHIPKNVTLTCREKSSATLHVYGLVDIRDMSEMNNTAVICHRSESGKIIEVNGDGVRLNNMFISYAKDILPSSEGRTRIYEGIRVMARKNIVIDGCEIHSHHLGAVLQFCEFCTVRNCTVKSSDSSIFIRGSRRMILENNYMTTEFVNASAALALQISGIGNSLNYVAYNTILHTMYNDREALTYDDHGMYYYGHALVDGTDMTCVNMPQVVDIPENDKYTKSNLYMYKCAAENHGCEWHGLTVYIVHGRGMGQYRNVISFEAKHICLDDKFDIAPDESSVFVVGAFNGRHIITDNRMTEAGVCVQTYPPNTDSIIARNVSEHAGGFNTNSNLLFRRKDARGYDVILCEINQRTSIVDNVVLNHNTGLSYQGIGYGVSIGANSNIDDKTCTTLSITAKRNRLHSFSGICLNGTCEGIIVEKNTVKNTYTGIRFGRGKFTPERPQLAIPRCYVIRKNEFFNVKDEMVTDFIEGDALGGEIR
ncbi:MAG: NosD domain-containing protein [Eubacteriales bacterium]|nr:NosD domain-containing protein [Eubacteriales bacterium]